MRNVSKYPEEIMDAARVLNQWLNSPDVVQSVMVLEELFYGKLKAAEKGTEDWLKSLGGLPTFVTMHNIEVMKAMTAEIGQIESKERD